MEFVLWAALLSGFLATLVMTAMIRMSTAAGMTEMPSFELMSGSMMSGDEKTAKTIGVMIHYVMMGTVVFGITYALLFQAFDSATWLTGLAIGVVHGVVVGVIFMPMMPVMHPRMGEPAVIGEQMGEMRLSSPGIMGKELGIDDTPGRAHGTRHLRRCVRALVRRVRLIPKEELGLRRISKRASGGGASGSYRSGQTRRRVRSDLLLPAFV